MIRTVACSSCSTTFPVDPRKVPEEGVYARCSACSGVFFVEGGAPPLAPPAEGPGEDAFSAGNAPPAFGAVDAEPGPPAESAPEIDQPDEWVFETEPEIDASSLRVERLDTAEEGLQQVQEDTPPFTSAEGTGGAVAPTRAQPADPAPELESAPQAPTPPAPSAPEATPAVPAQGFTFGRRDPHEKASRLARVLVSDIITYNPERHQRALDGGSLKLDFEDEIKKSWGEYVDQVGKDLAENTDYFNQALNEILACGQQVF